MTAEPFIAEIAALIGDPARANMLMALMDGRALTASELAYAGGITPQTASAHLGKLTECRLLAVRKQGRHRYYCLASPEVARMLESMAGVAAMAPPRYRPYSSREQRLRMARVCYDHLAGRLGVALTDRLVARGFVTLDEDGGEITSEGTRFFGDLGVDLAAAARHRRRFCRPCLDWTERRLHLGGAVGAALAARCFALDWLRRVRDSRAVVVTADGWSGLEATFGIGAMDEASVDDWRNATTRRPAQQSLGAS